MRAARGRKRDPYEKIAAQLLRALRGSRSQTAASRRIGQRSNVLYAWESGRRWPTAARFLQFAQRMRVDVRASLVRFYGHEPAWLARTDPSTPAGVAALLDDLRANRSVAELARAAGKTRSSVSRWLCARTEPRLPDFLRLIDVASLRLLDFVAELVDPARIPALAAPWRALETARRIAYQAPWAHAVLRALELADYQRLPAHQPGWIAQRLGISREAEESSLSLLRKSRQIRLSNGRFVPSDVMTVDTRRDARAELSLKSWTARIALDRMQDESDGLFSFNLFTVSEADLERLRELHRAFYRQLRAIVAASEPAERVVIANVQLFGMERVPKRSPPAAEHAPARTAAPR